VKRLIVDLGFSDDQVSSRPTIRLDGLSPEQQAEIEKKKEKLDFQVSIGKIMNLISSPIYPQKEVCIVIIFLNLRKVWRERSA